jgi:predicted nucleic acid-binding protein
MPTKNSGFDCLVDTSVAIAVVVEDHEHHTSTMRAVAHRNMGLAGHAAFETFSVLTRLPAPARRSPEAVQRLLSTNFPLTKYLSPLGAQALLSHLPTLGIAGGSVIDALVGAAALESGLVLFTRDVRAIRVYRALQVDVEVIRDER